MKLFCLLICSECILSFTMAHLIDEVVKWPQVTKLIIPVEQVFKNRIIGWSSKTKSLNPLANVHPWNYYDYFRTLNIEAIKFLVVCVKQTLYVNIKALTWRVRTRYLLVDTNYPSNKHEVILNSFIYVVKYSK